MAMPDDYNFNLEKKRAAERLRELEARSKYRQSGTGSREPAGQQPPIKESGFLSGFNLPFLNASGGDSDIALILGLVLILSAEKSDKLLLLALFYILI